MDTDLNLQIVRKRLEERGYAVIPNVFPASYIEELNEHCEQLLEEDQGANVSRHGRLGQLVDLTYQTEMLQELCLDERLWDIYDQLGFADARLWKGYIVAKQPTAPSTYWHQDWQFWSNPISYTPALHQVFVMIYLTDTRPSNGCLRVIPGSHRKRHELHSELGSGHADAGVIAGNLPYQRLFDRYANEQDVPIAKGDILVGDARLLHAVHGNQEGIRRNLIVFDLLVQFRCLPASVQNAAAETALRPTQPMPPNQAEELQKRLPARHSTSAELEPLNRTPSFELAS